MAAPDAGVKYFISDLSDETDDADLHQHFQKYGNIVEAVVVKGKALGKIRNYGILKMAEASSRDAIFDDRHAIRGQEVKVRLYKMAPEVADPKKVHLGNLDARTSVEDVRVVFSQFGTVLDVHTPKDASGNRMNYGFVTFETTEAYNAALYAEKVQIVDCTVQIRPAVPTKMGMGKAFGKGKGMWGPSPFWSPGGCWPGGCWGGSGMNCGGPDWCMGGMMGSGCDGYGCPSWQGCEGCQGCDITNMGAGWAMGSEMGKGMGWGAGWPMWGPNFGKSFKASKGGCGVDMGNWMNGCQDGWGMASGSMDWGPMGACKSDSSKFGGKGCGPGWGKSNMCGVSFPSGSCCNRELAGIGGGVSWGKNSGALATGGKGNSGMPDGGCWSQRSDARNVLHRTAPY